MRHAGGGLFLLIGGPSQRCVGKGRKERRGVGRMKADETPIEGD